MNDIYSGKKQKKILINDGFIVFYFIYLFLCVCTFLTQGSPKGCKLEGTQWVKHFPTTIPLSLFVVTALIFVVTWRKLASSDNLMSSLGAEWLKVSSISSVTLKRRRHETMTTTWHRDNHIIIAGFISTHPATHLGDTSFVRCQCSSQSSTGQNALCAAPLTAALHQNSFNYMLTKLSSADTDASFENNQLLRHCMSLITI